MRSDRRPYRGTLGDVDALARRVATGLRARGVAARRRDRVPAAELVGGGGDLLRGRVPRRGRRADRALLRPEGGLYILARDAGEGARHRRPVRRTRTSSPTSTRCAPTCPTSSGSRSSATTRGRGDLAFDELRRRRTARRARRGRPARARARRVHVGHHDRPEGCRALAPHDRRRDPPARRHPARRRLDEADVPKSPPSITGAPVGHGIGMLAALLMPGVPAQRRSTSSTCGTRAACSQAMLDDRLLGRAGLDVLPHEPARPSRLRPRAPRPAHAGHRARRLRGPGRGRRARAESSASTTVAQLRQHRAPVDHRLLGRRRRARSASTPTASRCPASRSGSSTTTATTSRSASPARSGAAGPTASSATPIPASPRPRSRPTVGS